ncbi:hypothetical protein R6Q59_024354 [Mikania micrantha]
MEKVVIFEGEQQSEVIVFTDMLQFHSPTIYFKDFQEVIAVDLWFYLVPLTYDFRIPPIQTCHIKACSSSSSWVTINRTDTSQSLFSDVASSRFTYKMQKPFENENLDDAASAIKRLQVTDQGFHSFGRNSSFWCDCPRHTCYNGWDKRSRSPFHMLGICFISSKSVQIKKSRYDHS